MKEHYKTPDKYFLQNHKPLDHHKALHNNVIMKHIERFRKMISLAVTLEWMEKDPFTKYKQKFDPVERQCLNIEELKRIEEKSFDIERISQYNSNYIATRPKNSALISSKDALMPSLEKGKRLF